MACAKEKTLASFLDSLQGGRRLRSKRRTGEYGRIDLRRVKKKELVFYKILQAV